MNTHRDKRTKRFRWVELVAAVVIPGTLAAIIVPRYTDASSGDPHLQVLALLHTIRSQLELYNVQNPATQYDETTVTDGTFWLPLLNGNFLETPPGNPLQNNSTFVGAGPATGIGWVWAESSAGEPWTLNLYAVDGNGGWFDGNGDGKPD